MSNSNYFILRFLVKFLAYIIFNCQKQAFIDYFIYDHASLRYLSNPGNKFI